MAQYQYDENVEKLNRQSGREIIKPLMSRNESGNEENNVNHRGRMKASVWRKWRKLWLRCRKAGSGESENSLGENNGVAAKSWRRQRSLSLKAAA
jgi:hypothetical protein